MVAKCTRADNALQKQELVLLRGRVTLTVGVSWQRPICRKQEAEGEGDKLVAGVS